MIGVGDYGKYSDGSIFSNSNVHIRLENDLLKPEPKFLPDSNTKVSFVFVGDEAFSLRTYLMRLYPRRQIDDENKKNYNYRLSRFWMTVEYAFGIALSRFRIF